MEIDWESILGRLPVVFEKRMSTYDEMWWFWKDEHIPCDYDSGFETEEEAQRYFLEELLVRKLA